MWCHSTTTDFNSNLHPCFRHFVTQGLFNHHKTKQLLFPVCNLITFTASLLIEFSDYKKTSKKCHQKTQTTDFSVITYTKSLCWVCQRSRRWKLQWYQPIKNWNMPLRKSLPVIKRLPMRKNLPARKKSSVKMDLLMRKKLLVRKRDPNMLAYFHLPGRPCTRSSSCS